MSLKSHWYHRATIRNDRTRYETHPSFHWRITRYAIISIGGYRYNVSLRPASMTACSVFRTHAVRSEFDGDSLLVSVEFLDWYEGAALSGCATCQRLMRHHVHVLNDILECSCDLTSLL